MNEFAKAQRRANVATAVAVIATLLAVFALITSARGDERGVDAIALQDSTGAVAARIGIHAGELVVVGSKGEKLFGFGLDPELPSFRVYDQRYTARARLEIGDRGPQLLIASDSGKPQVRVAGMRASAEIFLYDAKAYRRFVASTNESGTGLLLADANRRVRVSLNADARASRFILYDTLNNSLFSAPR